MDIATFLALVTSNDMVGLEIGPSHAPRFPKRDGWRIETVDHASAEELRAKYAGAGVAIDSIEDVDYISDGQPLHEVVPRRGYYDFVYSSHVIEHIPDFVSYFKSCELLLKPGGQILLTVPDKRFCFDALQNASTTGEVLQAYHDKRTRHTIGQVFDFGASMAQLDGAQSWSSDRIGTVGLINDFTEAKRHYDLVRSHHGYLDYHGWRFTPSSFRLVIFDLHQLGILEVQESMVVQSVVDFHVALSRVGRGAGKSRIELLRDIVAEQIESGRQLLSGLNA